MAIVQLPLCSCNGWEMTMSTSNGYNTKRAASTVAMASKYSQYKETKLEVNKVI